MAKDAKEYLQYFRGHEEERKLHKELSKEDFIAHVRELGYEFTDDEFVAEYENYCGELSDDDLDMVSGGCKDNDTAKQ